MSRTGNLAFSLHKLLSAFCRLCYSYIAFYFGSNQRGSEEIGMKIVYPICRSTALPIDFATLDF